MFKANNKDTRTTSMKFSTVFIVELEHILHTVQVFPLSFLNNSEAVIRGVLWKKVFLIISQRSQENTCARVSNADVFL